MRRASEEDSRRVATVEGEPGRTSFILERFRNVPLDKLLLSVPLVAMTVAVIVFVDTALQRWRSSDSGHASLVGTIALAVIAGALFLFLSLIVPGWHRLRSVLRGLPAGKERSLKSFVLSVQVSLLLLVPAAHLAVAKSRFGDVEWYRYGFLDKRWLFALYWILVAGILLFPPLIHRLLVMEARFETGGPALEAQASPPRARIPRICSKWIVAIALASFFFGPPWNIERTPLYVDFHEQVLLGPLQAIDRGSLPNIGPASQQYGPGTQLLTYAFMKLTGEFTLVGFRKAQAAVFFGGFALYAAVAFSYLGFSWGLLALLFSFSVSPFQLTYWNRLGGFTNWGWPNPLRYLGALFLVLSVTSVLMDRGSRRSIDGWVLWIGWTWGLFIWISPENLMMGALASALVASLLWATETVPLRRSMLVGINVLLGAILFSVPVLAFYSLQGKLSEYLSNTFSIGTYVLAGYSNTATSGSITNVPRNSILFYGFTPMVLAIGFVALHDKLSLRRPLGRHHALMLALVSVSLASFLGSLTRTGIYHLLNTLVALPLLLACAMKFAPSCAAATTRGRIFVRAGLVLFVFFIAFFQHGARWYASRILNPLAKYRESTMAAVPDRLRGGSFERTGYARLPKNVALEASVTPRDSTSIGEMSGDFRMLDGIAQDLQNRVTFFQSLPWVEPGFGYFFADVEPAPVLLDPTTMVVSSEVQNRFLRHFATIIDEIGCVVATDSGFHQPEVELFVRSSPDVVLKRRRFRGQTIYIACK